jgi:hypothetical protein
MAGNLWDTLYIYIYNENVRCENIVLLHAYVHCIFRVAANGHEKSCYYVPGNVMDGFTLWILFMAEAHADRRQRAAQ